MKKIKAVIFDWAGTTVDYGCMAPVQAFVEVFKQYGIEPTMEEVRKPMGMLKIDHIRTMLQMERICGLWVEKYGKEPGGGRGAGALLDLRGETFKHPSGSFRGEAGRGGDCEPASEKRDPDRIHHRVQ